MTAKSQPSIADTQFAEWCERHDMPPHSRSAFDDAASLHLLARTAAGSRISDAKIDAVVQIACMIPGSVGADGLALRERLRALIAMAPATTDSPAAADVPAVEQSSTPSGEPIGPTEGPAPATFMTEDRAREWAWDKVREEVGTEGWTTGDSFNFHGFFLWGWIYREQYELQRTATPPAKAPARGHEAARAKNGARIGGADDES